MRKVKKEEEVEKSGLSRPIQIPRRHSFVLDKSYKIWLFHHIYIILKVINIYILENYRIIWKSIYINSNQQYKINFNSIQILDFVDYLQQPYFNRSFYHHSTCYFISNSTADVFLKTVFAFTGFVIKIYWLKTDVGKADLSITYIFNYQPFMIQNRVIYLNIV